EVRHREEPGVSPEEDGIGGEKDGRGHRNCEERKSENDGRRRPPLLKEPERPKRLLRRRCLDQCGLGWGQCAGCGHRSGSRIAEVATAKCRTGSGRSPVLRERNARGAGILECVQLRMLPAELPVVVAVPLATVGFPAGAFNAASAVPRSSLMFL